MKNASKILFLVGGIVSIFAAVVYAITGAILAALSNPDYRDAIAQQIREGRMQSDIQGTPEQIAEAIQVFYLVLGIVFIVLAALCVANAVISFLARGKESKPMFILNIVFGALSSTTINLVGGILALVAAGQEERRANLTTPDQN